jgi:anti-sigma factor RsiW
MDLPLTLDEDWQLSVHLSRCDACRAVERDYREQRRALRQLGSLPPPRDLWARTSTELDRAMADSAEPGRRNTGRGGTVASVAASLSVLGAAALVVMSQWPLLDRPEPARLQPTPFAVPGQAVAYMGAGPQGLSIFHTSVDSVCPAGAVDCVGHHQPPATLTLSRSIQPSSLALSPSGRQLAISGRDSDREHVIAIVMMPEPAEDPPSADPSADPSAVSPAPVISVPPRPDPSDPIDPRLSPFPVDPTPGTGLAVFAILENALGVGAPPAWSGDGSVLAFSAMPADGSSGPDLYVWRPGDGAALKVTHDQSTYFASWSGSRIVASRATDGGDGLAPLPSTVIFDLTTGEEQALHGVPLWLPQINSDATHAVAWHGTLDWRGTAAVADIGELYLVDWTMLDPFAEPAAAPSPEPSETAAPVPPAPIDPFEEPSVATGSDTPDSDSSPRPDAPTFTATLEPLEAQPSEQPDPTDDGDEPTLEPLDGLLRAIEPDRDSERQPVRDWEVRWSPDGSMVGYWIADAPGSSWGRLAVMSIDAESGDLVADEPLLAPTLARRSFRLGLDRLAWVAPDEHNVDGELRLTTWGPGGRGVLRLDLPDVDGAIAPF